MNTNLYELPQSIYAVIVSTSTSSIEDSHWTTRNEARTRRKFLRSNGDKNITILRYNVIIDNPTVYRD